MKRKPGFQSLEAGRGSVSACRNLSEDVMRLRPTTVHENDNRCELDCHPERSRLKGQAADERSEGPAFVPAHTMKQQVLRFAQDDNSSK